MGYKVLASPLNDIPIAIVFDAFLTFSPGKLIIEVVRSLQEGTIFNISLFVLYKAVELMWVLKVRLFACLR